MLRSREAYAQLTTPPLLKPLDWTRSRTRREHLISMGVPVNLDEVDSHRLAALPPLRITTGAPIPKISSRRSEDSQRYTTQQKGKGKSRDSSPANGWSIGLEGGNLETRKKTGSGRYGIGERPSFATSRAEELCGIEEGELMGKGEQMLMRCRLVINFIA
jgi:hypothetical protein